MHFQNIALPSKTSDNSAINLIHLQIQPHIIITSHAFIQQLLSPFNDQALI